MENINWINIISWVLVLVIGYLATYLKTKTNVLQKVAGFIAEAEEKYKLFSKAGTQKKAWCIQQLNKVIPKVLKPFLSDEVLDILIQTTFEQIESYLTVVEDKAAAEINEKVEEISK